MKNFYEMLEILKKAKNEMYDPQDERPIMFTRVLGEDDDSPFSLELYYNDGDWTPQSDLFVKNGEQWDTYKNPGKNLMNVPEPIKSQAIKWIDAELDRIVSNYEEDDPRDYYDDQPRGREWDDQDQANYDRKLWLGGEEW